MYRVKAEHLLPYNLKAKDLLASFSEAKLQHVLRQYNAVADLLSNQAVDMS